MDVAQLLAGQAGDGFVRAICETGDLDKLAGLWVSGVEIEWPLLHPGEAPNRVSLPTYPFARKRYWAQEVTAPVVGKGEMLHPLLERISPSLSLAEGIVFEKSLQEADLVALDLALQALAEIDRRKSRVVELRFFGGFTVEETGMALGISPETVNRDWQFAKSWLRRELRKGSTSGS